MPAIEAALAQPAPQTPPAADAAIEAVSAKVDAYSIAGLKIGMSEQQVSSVLPQLAFKDRGPLRQAGSFVRLEQFSEDLLPEARGNVILELTLLENKLVNISVRWLPISFNAMLSKLHSELAASVNAETTQNVTQAGEKFTNTVSTWVGERTTVRYFQHFENIKQSRILVMERPQK